ncbi:MAG: pseudouridine synthase [Capsulimonadaceae bacterium]|nr:pseudouridine synthase [Capsulimonadaceae bacterium]
MAERLQKLIAAAGLASRRTSEQWIVAGRVCVDGVVVTELGARADPATQRVTVDGRPLPSTQQRHHYIVLHKPRGYTCTVSDPHAHHVIGELVDLPSGLFLRPVGRLDVDSEGLIFLSDDGDFINRMTHPRYHVAKTYLATVRGTPTEAELERLRKGVYIETGKTAPAERADLVGQFPTTDSSDIELVIHEGKNRQVRRMMSAIGHQCLRLVRTQIGPIRIKGLPSGAWRHLTPSEVNRLMTGDTDSAASSEPIFKSVVSRTRPRASARPAESVKNTHAPRRGAVRHPDTETRKRMDGLGPPRDRKKDEEPERIDRARRPSAPRQSKRRRDNG